MFQINQLSKNCYFRFCILAIIGFLTICTLSFFEPAAGQLAQLEGLPSKQLNLPSASVAQANPTQSHLLQGLEQYEAGRFNLAIENWTQALEDFQTQDDVLNQALVQSYLSLAYQQLGQWNEAEGAISTSFDLLERSSVPKQSVHALEVRARVFNTQGRLLWSEGEFEAALTAWQESTSLYSDLQDLEGVILSSINQAKALQSLGLNVRAEAMLNQLAQILEQEAVSSKLKAIGWWHLGNARRRIGAFKASLENLKQAAAISSTEQLDSLSSSIFLDLGNTERALGDRSIAINQSEAAQAHYQSAIDYYQQVTHLSTQFQAQVNLLNLLTRNGNIERATVLWPQLMELRDTDISRSKIFAHLNFAQSLTCLRQNKMSDIPFCSQNFPAPQDDVIVLPDESLPTWINISQLLTQAINDARYLQDTQAESYALGQLGMLYELNEQWSEAESLTHQALLAVEDLQASNIRYRWEWQLGRINEKQNKIDKAISAYQAAFETLKSVRHDLLTVDSEIQFSFRDNVEPVYRTLVDLLLRTQLSEPDSEKLEQAAIAVDALQLAELENFLRCNFTQTTEFLQRQTEESSTEIINQLDKNAALIYPIILPDRTELILKLPGQSLKHYVSDVSKKQIEQTIRELKGAIILRTQPERLMQRAEQLYDWIIRPLEADLFSYETVKTLVFVLDGDLRNVPMSVLYDGEQYLLEKPYSIALLPSLELFDLRTPRPDQISVLAAGISEAREVENRSFSRLNNVEAELENISKTVPTEILLNQSFKKESLTDEIDSDDFTTVHIATHGQFSSDPDETFILAYEQLLRSNDLDNLLRTDTQDKSDSIDLFVLSACESAQGDDRATLGLAGIAVRAGALTTVSTLWQVNDRTTALVMEEFYRTLANSDMSKAEALHQSQQFIFDKGYKSPFIWAPYVLVGNWL